MKRLILSVVVASAALIGQAASIDWNAGGKLLVDSEGTKLSSLTSGSIVLVLLSDNTGWTAGSWTAEANSLTELATAKIGDTSKSMGKISGNTYTFAYVSDATSPIKDGDVLAVVFKDSSGAYDQLEYYSSKDAVVDTFTVSGLATSGDTYAQTFVFGQSGNITAPVPEPTSAMLLVLGIAGLALKRKRA